MSKGAPIILGIIVAIFASFMIVGNMPVTVEDFEGNLTIDGHLNVTGTGEFGGDVDMNHGYILYSDFNHWMHFSLEAGLSDVTLNIIPAGFVTHDRHYHRIIFVVDTAPGVGKEVNVTLSNGANTMTVSLAGAEEAGWTDVGSFDWDVSEESLILTYTQDAGGASTNGFITIKYHYKETP